MCLKPHLLYDYYVIFLFVQNAEIPAKVGSVCVLTIHSVSGPWDIIKIIAIPLLHPTPLIASVLLSAKVSFFILTLGGTSSQVGYLTVLHTVALIHCDFCS